MRERAGTGSPWYRRHVTKMRPLILPRWLPALVSRLPQYPPAVAVAIMCGLRWGDALSGAALPAAEGKVVEIFVRDAGLSLQFRMQKEGITACRGIQAQIRICASADDFLALALREEDPDTLFFSRRLTIEGDTELGLLLKNTLDTLPAGTFAVPTPFQVLAAIRLQLR